MGDKKNKGIINSEQEKVLIEKTKKVSVKEACAYSFMDGFGLRYVTPYALSLGASNTQIGLLSSIPGLLGNLSQLFTIKAMKFWKRKVLIRWSVFIQAIMWILLIAAGIPFFIFGLKTDFSPNAVIVIYTLLILAGAFAGPAWTSLMRDIVTEKRGEYFGMRNRVAGVVALICMFVAGFVLDYFKQTHVFLGFAVLFFIAFLGRFVSSQLFKKHYEPKFVVNEKKYFTLLQFVKKMRYNNFGRFVLYFSLVSFAVAIAGPFFIVYYFKTLDFTYTQYMITVVANSLATLLLMPLWGKFADKYGNLKVMQITGFFIPLLPLLYTLTALIHVNLIIVLVVILIEIYSGVVWAGFNLAAGNFIYDAVTKERLSICSSYFNILNGFGALLGALLGGWLASHDWRIFGLSSLLFVFLISGIMRFVVYFAMKNKIREVREVQPVGFKKGLKEISENVGKETKKITREIANKLLKSISLRKFFDSLASESEHLFSSNSNNFAKNN